MTVQNAVYDVADYTSVITDHGTIMIKHEMTLGDMVVATSIATLALIVVLKFIIDKFWR